MKLLTGKLLLMQKAIINVSSCVKHVSRMFNTTTVIDTLKFRKWVKEHIQKRSFGVCLGKYLQIITI